MAGASRLLSLALPGPQLLAWAQERAHCCHLSRPLSRHDLQPAWIRSLQAQWSECSKITHTCAGEARRAWVSPLGRGQRHVGFPCGPGTQHSGWHSGVAGGGTPAVLRAGEQRWKGRTQLDVGGDVCVSERCVQPEGGWSMAGWGRKPPWASGTIECWACCAAGSRPGARADREDTRSDDQGQAGGHIGRSLALRQEPL